MTVVRPHDVAATHAPSAIASAQRPGRPGTPGHVVDRRLFLVVERVPRSRVGAVGDRLEELPERLHQRQPRQGVNGFSIETDAPPH